MTNHKAAFVRYQIVIIYLLLILDMWTEFAINISVQYVTIYVIMLRLYSFQNKNVLKFFCVFMSPPFFNLENIHSSQSYEIGWQ